jgi:cold shock CspA family protein
MTGVIDKMMGDGKRFGFIKPDGEEKNIFFHEDKMVDKAAFDSLKPGTKVSFDTEQDNQGRTNAINVQVVQ